MKVQSFIFDDLKIFSYIIADEATGQCAVIDPPRVIEPIVQYIRSRDLKPVAVLETHVHADFVSGSLEMKQRFGSDVLIYCSAMGGPEWLPHYANRKVKDSDTIELGSVLLQAKHTPGHTPEHVSWIYYNTQNPDVAIGAFTGDFLFVGGIGRPDLLGSNMTPTLMRELYESVFDRMADLPDALILYPAHGSGSLCGKSMREAPSSTLGTERLTNPSLKKIDAQIWMDALQVDMPGAPHTFARNKRINMVGAPLLSTLPKDKMEPTVDDILRIQAKGHVFDLRDAASFCKEHLQGALFVPFGTSSFGNSLASVMEEGADTLFVLANMADAERVSQLVRILGYDQQLYFSTWQKISEAKAPTQSLPQVSAKEALQRGTMILDVRTPEEWRNGHIAHSERIELSILPSRLASIPKVPVIVLCRSGNRSCVAASFLQRAGFTDVANLAGGIEAWKQASLPIEQHK
jgi:hydroxyacylglutathione hydrolase